MVDLHGITKFAYYLHVVFTFLLAAHGFLWQPDLTIIALNILSAVGAVAWIQYIESGGGNENAGTMMLAMASVSVTASLVAIYRRRVWIAKGLLNPNEDDDEEEEAPELEGETETQALVTTDTTAATTTSASGKKKRSKDKGGKKPKAD